MTTSYVCNYAPLRLLPYRDTGEFINVGVLLHCAEADNFFGWRGYTDEYDRIARFFPELDGDLVRKRLAHFVEDILSNGSNRVRAGEPTQRFRELVRPREGFLHFGPIGTVMAADPRQALDELYHRFVGRNLRREESAAS